MRLCLSIVAVISLFQARTSTAMLEFHFCSDAIRTVKCFFRSISEMSTMFDGELTAECANRSLFDLFVHQTGLMKSASYSSS